MFQCFLVIKPCVFINVRDVSNYCKFQLSLDIEKNPGPTPVCIDPSKAITVPYS